MDNMTFRTEIRITPWEHKLDYTSRIVTLGSCFADNIAKSLAHSKFRVTASPTGILFNPASIARHMELMARGEEIGSEQLFAEGTRYLSYNFHSSISGNSPENAIATMNQMLRTGAEAIRSSDLCIVTLGTAWVYRLRSSGEVVANCHKQPATLFRRELLSVDNVVEALERIMHVAPRSVLFTLSPVRHMGDGLEDNSLSKAILRVAIDSICSKHPDRAAYFPSYEIMMDDLRDYRFYNADMIHPSSIAVDYIAERFFDVALNDRSKSLKLKIDKIVRAAEHRPFDPCSTEYMNFCRAQLEQIAQLEEVDLSKEKSYFDNALQINL